MKIVLAAIVQFVLFLFVFGAFSFFPVLHLQYVIHSTPAIPRMFVADGLVLAFALYLVILCFEAAMKRLTTSAPATSIAFVLAVVLGFLMKFGFLTQSTF